MPPLGYGTEIRVSPTNAGRHVTLSARHVHDARLFPAASDEVISLLGGADLRITGAVPDTAAERRAALAGSVLYIITGWLDRPGSYLAGYVGQTLNLTGARPTRSWTQWVRTTARIVPFGLALVVVPEPIDADLLTFIECRVIQQLSAYPRCISLLNRQTSAQVASGRLTRAQVLHGQALADQTVHHVWQRTFRGRRNPWPAPAPNCREACVRIVQRAGRAVDVFEVAEELLATGHTSTAQQLDFSLRRDLEQRERSRGMPRIVSTWHARRRRRIWWNPETLTKREAVARYDAAHPPRTRHNAGRGAPQPGNAA